MQIVDQIWFLVFLTQEENSMALSQLVVLKKSGVDGPAMPVEAESAYIIGRAEDADIRVKIDTVSNQHAKLVVDALGQVDAPFAQQQPDGMFTGLASPPGIQQLNQNQRRPIGLEGDPEARGCLLD